MKPTSYAAQKRLIHLSKAFVNEASQVQSRRCEVLVALLSAHVTHAGLANTSTADVEKAQALAFCAVAADSRQKWTDLKALFVELGIQGPQPHIEWAAKQCGVTLFDAPAPAAEAVQ